MLWLTLVSRQAHAPRLKRKTVVNLGRNTTFDFCSRSRQAHAPQPKFYKVGTKWYKVGTECYKLQLNHKNRA